MTRLADSNQRERRRTGDTIAFACERALTREQFDAISAVFWAFHPSDWPDGEALVFPSGLEVTLKVVKNP